LLSSLQIVPACDDALKPAIGIKFDSLHDVEEFYKAYVHEVRFSVCIEAQGKVINVIDNKRFLCSKQGFSKNRLIGTVAPTRNPKKIKKCSETRCEYNTHIYVKLGLDNMYYIASMVQEHNHGLVSPNKISFL
jgi:hypothetical protein